MSRIELTDVTKSYDDSIAVDDISLTIEEGESLGIVGPSGCGKTTTLRTIAGFETPDSGTVQFDDETVTHTPPENRNVGLVFQTYALFDNMSVVENVEFGLKMQGMDEAERHEKALEVLELLDIDELADRHPQTLSGGQQQRVGIARALAIEPHILLLDEPLTGLDVNLKERLQKEIRELLDDLDMTALYVTHDQEEAMVMCDRIAVMNDGQIEQVGTPQEIYEEPANSFVANFVGASSLLPATVSDGTLDLGFAELPVEEPGATGDVLVLVRPEDVQISEAGDFEGTVVDQYYLGNRVETTVELPNGERIRLTTPPSATDAQAGYTVSIDLNTASVHIVDR